MKWLLSFVLLAALAGNSPRRSVQILPEPLADRTFQYTRILPTFGGTPLEVEALVPNALIVVGRQEAPELVLQAGQVAFMLGQWIHDAGVSLEKVKQGVNLAPLKFDDQVTESDLKQFNLIVLGTKNKFVKQAKLKGQGSFLEVTDAPFGGRQMLIVSDLKAASYLANKRLFFKAGAYNSFFAFVKARVFIEQNDLDAALFTLNDPQGIHGCARPVMLALSQKDRLPEQMLQVAKKRNKLVFKDLQQALKNKNSDKAKAIWRQAMETCYACHQGQDGVKRFRKFTPNQGEHAYHQKIAESAGVSCQTCHTGKTEVVGY
ncbi:cellulose biosynthesis cyclic di-GMP-binding regulatory protein BcsB [Calditrichota bacterium LG25]